MAGTQEQGRRKATACKDVQLTSDQAAAGIYCRFPNGARVPAEWDNESQGLICDTPKVLPLRWHPACPFACRLHACRHSCMHKWLCKNASGVRT